MKRVNQLITAQLKDIRDAYAKTFTKRNKSNLNDEKIESELNEFITKSKLDPSSKLS